MAKIYFRGFVLPLLIRDLKVGPLVWQESTLGELKLWFTVQGHVVVAECEMGGDTEDINRITLLEMWVFHLIRGYLDAVAFTRGIGLTLILNEFSGSDQIKKQLIPRFEDLAALCSFKPEELFKLTEAERGSLKHIHDLVDSLVHPLESFFLCGRAVEGFRKLLSTETDVPKQWEFMRNNLNLSKSYLRLITDMSVESRHGATKPVNISEIHEVRKRAWTVAQCCPN